MEYKLKGCHVLLYSFEGSPKHKDYGILLSKSPQSLML